MKQAKSAKELFVSEMFGSGSRQGWFGCGSNDSTNLFYGYEALDLFLTIALSESPKERTGRLNNAATAGRVTADLIAACPEADEGARAIARDIANRSEALAASHRDGALTDAQLQTGGARIASAKRRLISGQGMYDCDNAFDIYDLVKNIDLRLLKAKAAGGGERRRTLLDIAKRSAGELIEQWKRIPCDTVCSDGRDNDGDGSTDASDSGCLTGPGGGYDRSDRSEQHGTPAAPPCPGPGTTTPVDVFFSYQNIGSRIVRHNLRGGTGSSQLLIETDPSKSDFTVGGPVDLGTRVCGSGTTATAEWVRQGTAVSWHLRIANPSGVIPPANFTVHAGADTR